MLTAACAHHGSAWHNELPLPWASTFPTASEGAGAEQNGTVCCSWKTNRVALLLRNTRGETVTLFNTISATRLENQHQFVEAGQVSVHAGAITVNKPPAPGGCEVVQLSHFPQKVSKSPGFLPGSRTKACLSHDRCVRQLLAQKWEQREGPCRAWRAGILS